MGIVLSHASRRMKRFNVENRAHRILEKDKPTAAPKFPSNVQDYNRVIEEFPDYVNKQNVKQQALDDRLKQVYVTSIDAPIVPQPRQSDVENKQLKPLPLDRRMVEDFEFGFKEPVKVSVGKATLRQAMKFIGDHSAEPETWTAAKIADSYKLQLDVVEQVLKNFHSFGLHFSVNAKTKESITAATSLRNLQQQMLPNNKDEDNYDKLEAQLKAQHEENMRKRK